MAAALRVIEKPEDGRTVLEMPADFPLGRPLISDGRFAAGDTQTCGECERVLVGGRPPVLNLVIRCPCGAFNEL